MKKVSLYLISVLALFAFSCNEKKSNNIEFTELPKLSTINDATGDRVFTAGNFFTPDYTPYEPEGENVAGKLSLSSPSASGGKSESIVPGLRKLSDYKTNYSSKKSDFKVPEIKRMSEDESKDKSSSKSDQPFTVSDWGPQGVIPAEVRYPSFYVLFSEPVVAISALNQQSEASDLMKIEPAVKGTFRWNGTSLLSFDCTEAVNPMQVYKITVNKDSKSLSGKVLTGETVFSTEAAALKIIWSAPGYSKNKWIDRNEVPPELAKEFRVQFNYPVNAEEIAEI